MTYVITDPCVDCKDTACVPVCPVDAIGPMPDSKQFEGAEQLYIDPDSCIDCHLCVNECPVEAIYPETDLPEDKVHYLQINADWFKNQ